ncbi:Integral membrane protein [Colletotrichum asianum]
MRGRLDHFDEVDLTERQELVQRILHNCLSDPDFASSRTAERIKLLGQARGWCTLMATDLDLLKGIDEKIQSPISKRDTYREFIDMLRHIHKLVWWFTERPMKPSEHRHNRSEDERQKALKRDGGRCLFTRAICEVCHIVPFWTVNRSSMIEALLSFVGILFDFDLHTRLGTSFASRNDDNTAPGENNIVDKCSNMLCLGPELRRFWERGLFGLEPVGHCRRLKGSEDSWEVLDAKLSQLDLDGTDSEADETIDAKLSSIFTFAPDTEPVTTHNVPSKRSSQVDMDLDNDSKKPRTDEKGKVPETFSKGRPLLKQDIDDGYEYGIVLRFHWLPATTLTSLNAESPPLGHESTRHTSTLRQLQIWAKNPDELPDWDALQLQWFALRVLRLGGDVDPEIYNPHWTDNDENFSRRVVNDREGLRQELFMEMVLSTRAFNSRNMDVTNEPPESIQGARVDYVDDDLTERQRLIKSVFDACKSDPGLVGMRSKRNLKLLEQAVCWCTLMVMDIKQLRHLNERLHSNDQESYYLDLIICLEAAGELVYWFGRDPTEPWDQGRVVTRNEAEKNKATMRDQGLCVTTHSPADEACHIVPLWTLKWLYTMGKIAPFWRTLFGIRTIFYIKDRFMCEYRGRENKVAEHNIVDKCCNMICLSGQMRRCWEKGLFTFEPVGYCRRSKSAGEVSGLSSMLSSTGISDSTTKTAHTDSKASSQETTVKTRAPDANEDEASGLFTEGRRLQESDIDAGKEYGIFLRVRCLLKTTTLSSLMDSAPPPDTDPQDLLESWEELHEELEGLSVLPRRRAC